MVRAGVEGGLPRAVGLRLPESPLRDFLVPVIFGVVLVSLLLQGLTMPTLVRITGVSGQDDNADS